MITPLKKAAASLAMVLAWCACLGQAEVPAPASSRPNHDAVRKPLALPGLVINLQERCVDVESTICLHQGTLELVACTKGSKEHESIVAVQAKAMHIHTALLLLGAEPGNPAMRKAVDESGNRWVDVLPRGGQVDVFLMLQNPEGKPVEIPISKFMKGVGSDAEEARGIEKENEPFPTHTFLFCGSRLHGDGPGPRHYLADQSGNVISLSTFGDESLCLPGVHGNDNSALMWQVDSTGLPAVGAKVTLRLRPKLKPASKDPTDKE